MYLCIAITCPDTIPEPPTDATVSPPESTNAGSVVTYTCLSGQKLFSVVSIYSLHVVKIAFLFSVEIIQSGPLLDLVHLILQQLLQNYQQCVMTSFLKIINSKDEL